MEFKFLQDTLKFGTFLTVAVAYKKDMKKVSGTFILAKKISSGEKTFTLKISLFR